MVVQVHDSVFATPFFVLSTHPYQIHCMYFLQVRPHPRLQVKGTLICPPFNPRHSPNNPSHNKLIFGIHQFMYSSTVHLIQLLIVIVHLGVLSLLTVIPSTICILPLLKVLSSCGVIHNVHFTSRFNLRY